MPRELDEPWCLPLERGTALAEFDPP